MQRTRLSTVFYHSSWEVTEIRLEFAASKAASSGACQSMSSFTMLTIHGHRHYVYPKRLTFELFNRDKAKECSVADHRLPSSTATGKWQKAD